MPTNLPILRYTRLLSREKTMKIDTHKMISVGLMSLGVGILLAAGVQNMACAPLRTSDTLGTTPAERAVHVRAVCYKIGRPSPDRAYGSSGVAIGGDKVIIAAHSITPCSGLGKVWITTKAGVTLRATVESVTLSNDTAVLSADGLDAPPVRLGASPHQGDEVCAATAHPDRARICGTVAYVKAHGPGAIVSGLPVVLGNSGAGVYNSKGRLVGVVVTGCMVTGCGKAGTSKVGEQL